MIRKESYRSINMLNALETFNLEFTQEGYPKLYITNELPQKVIPFDKCIRSTTHDSWVHFYVEDYQFERVWLKPYVYLKVLSKFKGIISPDFSVYYDMPMHMKRWNIYRNKFIASFMQSKGINVIPNIQIVEPSLWDDVINGIERELNVSHAHIVGCCKGYKYKKSAGGFIWRYIDEH